MAVSVTHTFVSPVADAGDPDIVGPNEWNDAHQVTGLGTAAEANVGDFATAAQGATADTAVQPGDLAMVATTGAYADLSGKPTLGTAAAETVGYFATAAQGALADTALQPAAIGVSVQAYDADLTAWAGVNPSSYLTAAQVAAAYQPLDADLTAWAAVNPSSYSTTAQIAAAYQALDADLTAIAGLSRTRGDLIRGGASAWERVALGTAGYALKSDGTDAVWTPSREVLTANRTYYVRTDGSDTNNGLTNSSGGAFLTIANALSVAAALDCSIYNVTIQVGAGTWTVPVVLPQMLGSGTFTLLGDTATPANVIISTAGAAVTADGIRSTWVVAGFKLQTSSGDCILSTNGSLVRYNAINFGTCARAHVSARSQGAAVAFGATSITGGALIHWNASDLGHIYDAGFTITLTGTPAFTNAFVQISSGAVVKVNNNTFSGAATGPRYNVITNAVCDVNGGGSTYLPGNAAHGTPTATGGQYN